eukprot:TRINITY_DN26638_c0_g1_i1.p1 TRINITY_DN26638_c0_g1~~TRINITY_DN26638_c0_g1_i1.p1  ORF type:complete len:185 (-),score=22.52 TRINITY_DN26638_c0_g1_i1:360-914(-)
MRYFIVLVLMLAVANPSISFLRACRGRSSVFRRQPVCFPLRAMAEQATAESAPKKCKPCAECNEGDRLDEAVIRQRIAAEVPLWQLRVDPATPPGVLVRSFVAKNFMSAMEFLNAAGQIAERENHHPDFHLTSYRNVEVVLYTHSLKGLCENDLLLASMLDKEIKVAYSPKWLKEHPEAAETAA